MFVRRRDSLRIMRTPRRSWSMSPLSSARSVSPQPVMAVRGVRSSWETEEMNSVCIFSLWLIFSDMSLMLSTSSPISSEYLLGIWMP